MGTVDTETLSPAESAYLSSKGQDTAALEQEYSSSGNVESSPPATEVAPAGTVAAPDKAASGTDDDIDLETDTLVTVGPDGKPRGSNGQFVPHKAFHAVRERYKVTRDELAHTKEKFARADERLALLNEVLAGNQPGATQTKPADDTPPDPEKDIFGYVRWQAKQIEKLSSQLTEGTKQQETREQTSNFQKTYIADAMAFTKSQPEFKDAYSHLINGRDKELALMGMDDAKQRAEFIAKEERAIVEQALQRGVSPSQMLYQLAQSRGFTAKPAAAAQRTQPDIASKIENVRRQQSASASLTGTGGSSGEGLTAAALADMSEEQFEAVMSKLSRAERARLLGG